MEVMTLAEVLALPPDPVFRYPVRNREPRVQMSGRKWHLIYDRDGGVCWICGRPVPKGSHHVDHLIPRSSFDAGDLLIADRSDNLAVACPPCNEEKSNWSVPYPHSVVGVTSKCWGCTFDHSIDPEVDPEGYAEHWRDRYRPELTVPAFCGVCGYTWVPDAGWLL